MVGNGTGRDYLVEVFEVATDEEEDEEIYDDPLYMEDQPAKI